MHIVTPIIVVHVSVVVIMVQVIERLVEDVGMKWVTFHGWCHSNIDNSSWGAPLT